MGIITMSEAQVTAVFILLIAGGQSIITRSYWSLIGAMASLIISFKFKADWVNSVSNLELFKFEGIKSKFSEIFTIASLAVFLSLSLLI
jgi:hypothetical protein